MHADNVSDYARNLFLSGTPVPLTVQWDILIVAKVANIVGRGVKSLSRLSLYSEEDYELGRMDLSLESFSGPGRIRIPILGEMRFTSLTTNWNR